MKEKIELGQIFCGKYSENCEVDRMSCPFSDCMAEEWAEKILSLGYHKTIWHKVADGDLPKYPAFYFCHYKGIHINSGEPYEAAHEMYWNGKRFITDNTNQVIAWTELPKYKE